MGSLIQFFKTLGYSFRRDVSCWVLLALSLTGLFILEFYGSPEESGSVWVNSVYRCLSAICSGLVAGAVFYLVLNFPVCKKCAVKLNILIDNLISVCRILKEIHGPLSEDSSYEECGSSGFLLKRENKVFCANASRAMNQDLSVIISNLESLPNKLISRFNNIYDHNDKLQTSIQSLN